MAKPGRSIRPQRANACIAGGDGKVLQPAACTAAQGKLKWKLAKFGRSVELSTEDALVKHMGEHLVAVRVVKRIAKDGRGHHPDVAWIPPFAKHH